MTLLRVRHLTKNFGNFVAVDDVSFALEEGQIFGLLGPNGSGKSTIIRMLCGLLRPTNGEINLDGIDVIADPDGVKRRIGYMSQKFSLYRDLTVWENLTFYGGIYGLNRNTLRRRRDEVVQLVGIGDYLHRLAGNLSGGWQQRLALGCAMLHEPRIMFLDEPTAGIDPVARRQLWDLLFELSSRGTTFLVTTHYMDEAERCTQVSYLFLSKMIAQGRPEELKNLPGITPTGTHWLQIECDQTTQAYMALRDSPGVRSATIFGQALHVLSEQNVPLEELEQRLSAKGLTGLRSQVVQPSLEDVFVTLTQEHLSQRGREAGVVPARK